MNASQNGWLLIDIGNTHTVAGFAPMAAGSPSTAADDWTQIRLRTDPQATADELRAHLSQFFAHRGLPSLWESTERVVVSSVVPSLERTIREASGSLPMTWIDSRAPRDFELALPQPETLGADRLANVAGALTRLRPPFLIIDAGTATTFCLVDASSRYIGGAITPGLETGWKALQSRAAKLFSVELRQPDHAVGDTTETQIQSGVLLGYEALITGLTDRLIADAQTKGDGRFDYPRVLLTGGCANLFRLPSRFEFDPDLTLRGLIRYGELHSKRQ